MHTLKGSKTTADYDAMGDQAWWRHVAGWVEDDHPDEFAKNGVLAA
ncbi:MAG: hypothetical protein L7V86_04390 [Verrucomicrobiales bacterium]|nr:hypothetical protein [Verrucomicrobiales bacterium]